MPGFALEVCDSGARCGPHLVVPPPGGDLLSTGGEEGSGEGGCERSGVLVTLQTLTRDLWQLPAVKVNSPTSQVV